MAIFAYECLACNITLFTSSNNLMKYEKIIKGVSYSEYIELGKFNDKMNIMTITIANETILCNNCNTTIGMINKNKLYLLNSRLKAKESKQNDIENKLKEISLIKLFNTNTYNQQIEIINELTKYSILNNQLKIANTDIIEKLNKTSLNIKTLENE